MATTPNEPKDLIMSVAAENGVFTEEMAERAEHDVVFGALLKCARNLKKIASNATEKLAGDLYSVDTHFVLECIQNAADNRYKAGVEPFLRICAQWDRIQLDCNETGFTPADIEAICGVGGSNKTSKEGFIGAKGIGFKSVFKIAQEAHIYSPPYSFKFDKGRELGMIIPIWVPEEEVLADRAKDCQTSILLLPPSDQNFSEHLPTFKALSPTLLLFLPKLRRLEIIIHDKQAHSGEVITRRTLRSKVDKGDNLITLTVEDSSSPHPVEHRYRKITAGWKAVEGEDQREGVKSSEIVLAFPVTSEGIPLRSSQQVHAFLPILDFGFKFVIQADFIVAANRRAIHESTRWNIHQRLCISHTFLDAIRGFLLSPNDPLRYTWVRFLPRGIKHPFWKPTEKTILQLMQQSEVLESRAKSLHRPGTLERLVAIVLDRGGNPLIGSPSEYLAPNYAKQDIEILEELGVPPPSWSAFLTRLCKMTDSELKSKDQQWHEDLAKALREIEKSPAWKTFSSRVMSKAFIPLLNGINWVPAVGLDLNPVYFQESVGRIKVPSDISPRFVEESASNDPYRKRFFKLLGVKDYDQTEAASAILRKHQQGVVPTVTEDEAVAHALYLYDLDSSITDKMDLTRLWLYDEQGRAARGQDLYVRDTSPYGPVALFDGHKEIARFLSSRYSNSQASQPNKPSLLRWLMTSTGLTDIPRLNKSGALSPEFQFILRNYPDKVLYTLKTFWKQYKRLMAKTTILDAIKTHPTTCSDGQTRTSVPLKDCYVPDSQMKLAGSELCGSLVGPPFLSIEPFNASEWEFLSTFGVGIAPDLSFYLWIGRQSQFQKSCTIDGAKKLLKYIADLTGFDERKQIQVRSAFNHDKLLLAQLSGKSAFTFPRLCVWKAPKGFRKMASLESLYGGDPSVTSLIRTTLQVEDASVEVVVDDLASGDPSDSHLKESLQYIALKLHSQQDHGTLQHVRDAFRLNPLIALPVSGSGSIRVCSSRCVWGGPCVTHKWNLQPCYEADIELQVLLCSHLGIRPPTCDDLMDELILLKTEPQSAVGQTEQIYSYISERFSGPEILKRFERDALVCVLDVDGTELWKRPSECVWTAPDFLRCKIPIAERHGFTEASAISLLQNTLSIRNASLADYIADLKILHGREEIDVDGLEVLYKSIELSIAGHEDEVKKTFDEENLVYGHQLDPPRWVKLGDCVWSGPKCLQTITKLARCYPSLDRFFTKYLGVQDATPETVLDELRFAADIKQRCKLSMIPTEVLLRRVTDLLLAFTLKSFTLSPSILEALRSGQFWYSQLGGLNPCSASDLLVLGRLTDNFIIPDHEYFLDLFPEKFNVLNLTTTEVVAMKPLFIKLGVENKFLSNCVTEIASADDMSLPDKELSHELSKRARALFCCAEHFSKDMQDNRRKGLYQLLKNIQVFRASDISTTYTIKAHGINQSVTTKGLMRLDEKGDQLRLFVPRDENDQKEAFAICLAKEMIRFLRLPEAESWHIITAVLAVEPERLDSFLHRQGISNNHSTVLSDAKQAKKTTVCSEKDDIIILDEKFQTLSLSLQQSGSKDNVVSAYTQPTSTSTIVQSGSTNIKTDVNQDLTSSDTTCQNPLEATNRSDPARKQPESELLLAVPERNIGNTHTISTCNSGSGEQNFSLVEKNLVAQESTSKHELFSWVSSPPRARGSSDTSHYTETSTTSWDSFDAASHSSATTSSSDEAKILDTPSKKTTKTAHQHQIEGLLHDTYQESSFSSTSPAKSAHSTPRTSHGGPNPEVGFAGEQFIVNILKKELEDFDGIKNWTSKLRKRAHLPPLGGEEETDLEYQDSTGCFSRLLRTWTDGKIPNWLEEACKSETKIRPKYWLEVKTTPGHCETVFFVSPHQYELMEKWAVVGTDMPSDVYVILRVFNVGLEPGVIAYLDPWAQSKNGRLKFDVQYKVTIRH
ncbi:hypothetical protein EG329_001366 [Mollisiaceae sp. DMI_Dod_QoI]|nr:hypothetical protein EG329_001366 [Helotiales sp. DMI_Dod_QoI]